MRKEAEGTSSKPRPGTRKRRERRVTVSYYLPMTLVVKLDELAAESRTPVSWAVELLLEAALEREGL